LDHDLSGDGEALFRLGLLDIEAGQFAQAKTRLEDALRRFTQGPDRARTLAALSDICLEGDDLAGARKLLEEAVVLRPHPELLHRLARVCRRMGDGEAADRHTLAAQGLQEG
jgi:Flp pilus assembly protein TadD